MMGTVFSQCGGCSCGIMFPNGEDKCVIRETWLKIVGENPKICGTLIRSAMAATPRVSAVVCVINSVLTGNQLNQKLAAQTEAFQEFLHKLIVEFNLEKPRVAAACEQLAIQYVAPHTLSLTLINVCLSVLVSFIQQRDYLIDESACSGKEAASAWRKFSRYILTVITDTLEDVQNQRPAESALHEPNNATVAPNDANNIDVTIVA